jgi:hypothetical protein
MKDANTVFFTPWGHGSNMMNKAAKLYEESGLFDVVQPGDKVAVKLHVGELGNPNYIRPFFLKQIVDEVKARGGKPFLTDTCTYYPLKRNNAIDHMETAVANGFGFAPFIVADGLMSENGIMVDSPDPLLSEVEVAGAIHQADAMIVVSHFKGHGLTGFGGAIKNLGMGGVTQKSKLDQHRLLDLVIDEQACQACGTCVDACWFGLPRIENDCVVIDSPLCMRCPICSSTCPEGAITLENREKLPQGLAVAAKAVLDTFDAGKVACINFATDISTECDCAPIPGQMMGQDVGIFASSSALSVDAAGLASIDYQKLNELHSQDCHQQVRKMVELGTPGAIEPQVISV